MTPSEKTHRNQVCEYLYGIYLVLAGWEFHPLYTQKYRMIGELRMHMRNYEISPAQAVARTMSGYSWAPWEKAPMEAWLFSKIREGHLVVHTLIYAGKGCDPSVLRSMARGAMDIENIIQY